MRRWLVQGRASAGATATTATSDLKAAIADVAVVVAASVATRCQPDDSDVVSPDRGCFSNRFPTGQTVCTRSIMLGQIANIGLATCTLFSNQLSIVQ